MPWLQAPPPPTSSSKANLRRSWIAWRRWPRSSVSASRVTSRMSSPFLPDPMRPGSMAKCCVPTAESSERIFTSRHQEKFIMKGIIVVTGASSGFGRLTAEALALNGHTVYAAMRETAGRNAPQVQAVKDFSARHKADLRAIELDVGNQGSVDAAIESIIKADGHIDTVVHNAGHMVFGPAEAFTPEQFAELYDINVLSTQRVNRAV